MAKECVGGVLPYQYEGDSDASAMAALAGLPVYLDLAHVAGLFQAATEHVRTRASQGWTDAQLELQGLQSVSTAERALV